MSSVVFLPCTRMLKLCSIILSTRVYQKKLLVHLLCRKLPLDYSSNANKAVTLPQSFKNDTEKVTVWVYHKICVPYPFFCRLHENVQYFNSKASLTRPNEFETATVSRSPSFASLPLGQKSALTQSQQSIISATSVS